MKSGENRGRSYYHWRDAVLDRLGRPKPFWESHSKGTLRYVKEEQARATIHRTQLEVLQSRVKKTRKKKRKLPPNSRIKRRDRAR